MELQKYLRQKGLDSLKTEFNIKVNRHQEFNNLVCLKYSQLESPLEKLIVQQCRGIILDEANDWAVVSYPYVDTPLPKGEWILDSSQRI